MGNFSTIISTPNEIKMPIKFPPMDLKNIGR